MLLAACSTSPPRSLPTTSTTTKVILSDGCQIALQYVNTHPPSSNPGSDSVVAASCTPAELRSAIGKEKPSLSSHQVAMAEIKMADELCAKYPNLKLCMSAG